MQIAFKNVVPTSQKTLVSSLQMAVTDGPIVQPCVMHVWSINIIGTQRYFVHRWLHAMWRALLLHPRFCCKKPATGSDFSCETALEKIISATTGSEGKWCDVSTNRLDVNSARCLCRDTRVSRLAEMAALLVLVTVLGITQGLPQCRDEDNNTVDW